MPLPRLTPFLLCLLLALAAAAEPDEQWYVVLQGDTRIGTMRTATVADDAGNITTSQDVKLAIGRAGQPVTVEVSTTFEETPNGGAVAATSSLNLGGRPLVTRAKFHADGIEVTAGQGDAMTTTTVPPLDGDWLPPAAAGRRVAEQLDAGAEVIEVRTVDVSLGLKVVNMTMRVVGREDVEAYGKTVPAVVWDATSSATPGMTMREYVDAEGETIRSTVEFMPGMTLTIVRADRELAESALSPVEMIGATLVEPSRRIDRPRELTHGVYRLTTRNGAAMPELPTLKAQTVEHDGDAVLVTVNTTSAPPASAGGRVEVKDAGPGPEYLEASPILNHEDPEVKAIGFLTEALMSHSEPTAGEKASFFRSQVNHRIKIKDLSVGFATASDVARTKQGDCTEHAVLLAALLRGAGIPSRCVTGLVYADQFAGHEGVFGFHMWTQAWVEGRWVDYDATLPDGKRFDATHIALSVSDLNDGIAGSDMAAMVPLLGNLNIEVIETGHDTTQKDQ